MLTHIIKEAGNLSLLYIPMHTEPMLKERNMKYTTYELGVENELLFQLMKEEFDKEYSDIKVIQKYFVDVGIHLSMISILSAEGEHIYFDEHNRKEYFDYCVSHYKNLINPTMVFVDPDVGSDVGITRRFRSNRKMYVRKQELLKIKNNLKPGDFIGYFQHLGNSNYKIEDRLKDILDCFGEWTLFTGYDRIQAGIVFLFNDEVTYKDKRKLIEEYFKQHDHLKHKNKFILKGNHREIGGFSAL